MDLLTLLLAFHCFDPPASDVNRLPSYPDRYEQSDRCKEQLARLRWLRSVRGYQQGVWDRAIAEAEESRAYWGAVQVVLDSPNNYWTRRALQSLKDQIGAERYRDGWRPPALPSREVFLPLGRPDPPVRREMDNP